MASGQASHLPHDKAVTILPWKSKTHDAHMSNSKTGHDWMNGYGSDVQVCSIMCRRTWEYERIIVPVQQRNKDRSCGVQELLPKDS